MVLSSHTYPSRCMRMSMQPPSGTSHLIICWHNSSKCNRINATIIDKNSKQVRVIEMSCPWLENRDSKDFKQTTKYSQMRLQLTNRYPEYKVNQYNIIMDVLGGCSKEVEQNIKELVGDKCESIMRQCKRQSCLVHYTLRECSS